MEQGTLIGNILAWVLLVIAMTFDFVNFSLDIGKLGYFVDIPSLMIVFGGTIASTFILHPMDEAKTFGKSIGVTFKPNNVQLVETLTLIVDVAKIARKNILAIEDALPSIENLFLRSGLRLVVDRVDRQAIVDMMSHEMKFTMAGKDSEAAVLGTMGSLCPAWGMLGTLVGLVQMLADLENPETIGPAMAVALLTTLYGAMLANMFALPVSDKLSLRSAEEQMNKTIIIESVLGIQDGQNPKVLEQVLRNYLPPSQRESEDAAE